MPQSKVNDAPDGSYPSDKQPARSRPAFGQEDRPGPQPQVSRHYYRNLLGLAAEEKKLVPTADLLRIQAQDRARDLALDRYFQGRLSHMHPLHSLEIPVEVVQDKEEIVWRLRQARKIMLNDPDKDSPAYSDVARKRLQQSLELLLDQSLTEPLRPQDPGSPVA